MEYNLIRIIQIYKSMKKIIVVFLTGLSFSAFCAGLFADSTTVHNYVGAEVCGLCHKTEKQGNQLKTWQNSLHSQAFNTLLTDKANKIARDKGFPKSAAQTPECLKCHATGYDLPTERMGSKFNVTDGVQCETCHGPGSEYRSLHIMKNRELSEKNGLFIPDSKEEFCKGCHNEESPTFVSFDFEKAWGEISHPVPEINK